MLSLLNINSASVMGWLESAATQQWIVGILLLLLFICFIKEWMPVEITALAGTAVLMLTGILSTRDVLSSFANSGPLTVVCMFILSASLERTGLIGDLSKLFNKVAFGPRSNSGSNPFRRHSRCRGSRFFWLCIQTGRPGPPGPKSLPAK